MIAQRNSKSFFRLMILLTLPLAMFSGLFMAPWIGIIMITFVILNRSQIRNIRPTLPEIALIGWAALTCVWSIYPSESWGTLLYMIFALCTVHLTNQSAHNIFAGDKALPMILTSSILLAVAVFLIEYFTNGLIYATVRSVIQPDSRNIFNLSWLDRGCSILSICSWPAIYSLAKHRKYFSAALLYSIVFITLAVSDSTAGLIGFSLAGVTYIALYLSRMRLAYLGVILIAAYMVAMPIVSSKQDPHYIVTEYESIPISHAHRLFIWKFVSEKSMDNPLLGIGIGASKYVPVLNSDMIDYQGIMLHTLPRHPHNNVLQIWLEMGGIGLIISIWYIWSLLKKIRAASASSVNFGAASHAAFINYFFIGMVSFGIWQSWWLLTALFANLLMNAVRNEQD